MTKIETKLQQRRTNYEALAYYSARAEAALDRGDFMAHHVWATKWHALNSLMEGDGDLVEATEILLGVTL